jgi:hypothetical protein
MFDVPKKLALTVFIGYRLDLGPTILAKPKYWSFLLFLRPRAGDTRASESLAKKLACHRFGMAGQGANQASPKSAT